MAAVTVTTRLDAVNRILSVMGEQPVVSLTPPVTADVTMAVNILNEADLETQTKGWHFNADYDVVLVLDGSNKYAVPANVVRVSVSRGLYPGVDLTVRDDAGTLRLYDKKNRTFVLPAGMKAELVQLFDFEKTPEAYRRYVTIRAARIAQDRIQGDPAHHAYTERDEIQALKHLKQHEGSVDVRTIFDNYAAYRVIDRGYPAIWGEG
jgi:hypothetical protein